MLRAPHAEFINPSAKCKHQQLPSSSNNEQAKHQQWWQKLAKFKHKLMQQQRQEQKPSEPGPTTHPSPPPPLPTIFCPFGQATFTVVVIVAIPALVIVVASAPNARYRSVCMRVCMHRKKINKIKNKIKWQICIIIFNNSVSKHLVLIWICW